MKKLAGFLVAAFTLCAPAAHAAECRSETARDMDINELTKTLPPDQALNVIILLDPQSALFQQIKKAEAIQYGAILNGVSGGRMNFDPDSARRLNGLDDQTFNVLPTIVAHGCLPAGTNLIDALKALGQVPGIQAAAPDVKLYEPLQPSSPGPTL